METIFYDGACGLCHATVRFVANHDAREAFEFAPLGGEYFQQRVPIEQRAALPCSVVVLTDSGGLLTRSAAVLHAMKRLGEPWRFFATVASLLPASLLDWLYDRIAAVRKRLFAPPADTCPMLPGHLRGRFRV